MWREYSGVKYIKNPATGNRDSAKLEIIIPECGNHNETIV